MSSETLQVLRTLIPGFFITLGIILTCFILGLDLEKIVPKLFTDEAVKYSVYLALFAAFGAIYNSFDFRRPLFRILLTEIDNNIKYRIVDFIQTYETLRRRKLFNTSQLNYLKEGNKIKYIFYDFIDSDESLKLTSQSVYFNGAIMSSAVDLTLISLFFACLLGLISLVSITKLGDAPSLCGNWMLILCLISSFGYIMQRVSVKNHIKLSNEQINRITQKKRKELQKNVIDLLTHAPLSIRRSRKGRRSN